MEGRPILHLYILLTIVFIYSCFSADSYICIYSWLFSLYTTHGRSADINIHILTFWPWSLYTDDWSADIRIHEYILMATAIMPHIYAFWHVLPVAIMVLGSRYATKHGVVSSEQQVVNSRQWVVDSG